MTAIDQAVIQDGVRLTAIGMGTAFGLLLLLTLLIALVGRLVRSGPQEAHVEGTSPPAESATDAHDKALAAVVAVSAVMGEAHGGDTPGESHG